MAITFGGLITGLDTNSIISQLVAAEKMPENLIKQEQSDANARGALYAQATTDMTALATAVGNLSTVSDVRAVTATSSDTTKVQVAASSAAIPSQHSLTISQLASSQTTRSSPFASDTAGIAGTGSLSMTVGTGTPITINYDATDTLDSIAGKISSSGAPVSASVLFDGSQYRLIVQGTQTGQANAVSFTDSGAGLGLSAAGATVVPAADAKFTLDGTDITRPTNVISDVSPGLTFTLNGTTPAGGTATSISISDDAAGVRTKVQTFVDAFNAISSFANTQNTYAGVKKNPDTLFGDESLERLQRSLGSTALDYYGDGTTSATLKSFGVDIDQYGAMTIDSSTFDAAVAKDPTSIEKLFAGKGDGQSGLAAAFTALTDQYTNSVDGAFTTAQTSITKQVSDWDKDISEIEDQANQLETRLTAQFSQLEQISSSLQTQMSFIQKIGSTSS